METAEILFQTSCCFMALEVQPSALKMEAAGSYKTTLPFILSRRDLFHVFSVRMKVVLQLSNYFFAKILDREEGRKHFITNFTRT
jgi:hypothetical protein